MAEFTMDEKRKYLRVYFGSNCPKCESDNIEGVDSPDVEGSSIYQEIQCKSCGVRWYDIYKLADIEIIDEDEND